MFDPIRLPRPRPGGKQFAVLLRATEPAGQTAPPPLFGPLHQVGTQGIALDVPRERVKMLVLRDGERLEAALIDVAAAGRVAVGVPALRVREGQPADELRQLAILPRPDDEVPVVGHHAVGQEPRPRPLDSLDEDSLKRLVVAVAVEDGHPRVGAVQHVIDVTTFGSSQRTAHPAQRNGTRRTSQQKGS